MSTYLKLAWHLFFNGEKCDSVAVRLVVGVSNGDHNEDIAQDAIGDENFEPVDDEVIAICHCPGSDTLEVAWQWPQPSHQLQWPE